MRAVVLVALLFAEPIFPSHQGLVTDTASMLTADQREALAQSLLDYRNRSTNVIAVLTIATLDGLTVEEYANKVFHAWGVGDAQKDNGVLLLWAIKERKIRIEVGYGLEPSLPDGRAGQIIRDDIVPQFRNQQWYAGLHAGTQAIITQLDQRPAEAVTTVPSTANWPLIIGVVLVGLIGVALVAACLIRRSRRQPSRGDSDLADHVAYRPRHRSASYSSRSYSSSSDSSYVPMRSSDSSSSSSSSWSDSSSSSSSSSDSGSFGGGDSGGGGASGSY